jgi:hypothetical protein
MSRLSPQRAQDAPVWTGNSVQQAAQIGMEESCGRGEPQRLQDAGRRAQLIASMGLRRTRATARQREVSDGGTSIVSEPESLRKTHLTWVARLDFRLSAPPCRQYTRTREPTPRQFPEGEPSAAMPRNGCATKVLPSNLVIRLLRYRPKEMESRRRYRRHLTPCAKC